MLARRVLTSFLLALVAVPSLFATGETVNGFPNWQERAMLELMNRARSAPATDLAGCGANCQEPAGCYTPIAPLTLTFGLNKSARFHSAEMGRNAFFNHPTPFVLRADINTVYPSTCDGSAACASTGAGSTDPFVRISYFGVGGSGEIIAGGQASPSGAHYTWLNEASSWTSCSYDNVSGSNGHRYLILKGGPGIGTGYANVPGSPYTRYYTGDFGTGGAIPKIPSGTHWGAAGSTAPNQRQSSSIEFWANWYDAAGPLSGTVVVDGLSHVMAMTRGTATNGAWSTTLGGLATGCHRYYFLFTDSGGTPVRYPTTGTLGIGDDTCADWTLASPRRADFNGDNMSDAIWRKSTTGEDAMWLMTGVNIISPVLLPTVSDTNWKMAGVGDFDGDGKADVIWLHDLTGQVVVWLMNGTSLNSAATVTTVGAGWKIAGVGDANADGKADVFWRNQVTGEVVVWLMNGTGISSAGSVGTVSDLNYTIAGVGDFDGDGKSDLFWRHGLTGQNVVWLMNGTSLSSGQLAPAVSDTNYKVVGIGDSDADGKADVFWWNQSTGDVVVWLMSGATRSGSALVTTVSDVAWHVEGVGDFDGDGKADLMWRKINTGEVVAWLMNGFSLKQATFVTQVGDLNWSIVAPR